MKSMVGQEDSMIRVLPYAKAVGWPKDKKPLVKGEIMSLADALTREFPTDAHMQLTSVPGLPYRIKIAALPLLPDGVPVVAMVFDVDAHGLPQDDVEEWWDKTERAKVFALFNEIPGGFCYRTRGGYRIVYYLPEPTVIKTKADTLAWHFFYRKQILRLYRDFGIVADPACVDWAREFRVPHATRA